MNSKICDGFCNICNDFNLGTHIETQDGVSEFVCANCDREVFDIASSRQKDRYLTGAKFDQKGVY